MPSHDRPGKAIITYSRRHRPPPTHQASSDSDDSLPRRRQRRTDRQQHASRSNDKRTSTRCRRGRLPANELILLPLQDSGISDSSLHIPTSDFSTEPASASGPSASQSRLRRHSRLISVLDRQRNYQLITRRPQGVKQSRKPPEKVSIGDHPAFTRAELKARSKPSPIKLIINRRSVRKTPTRRRLVLSQILEMIGGPLPDVSFSTSAGLPIRDRASSDMAPLGGVNNLTQEVAIPLHVTDLRQTLTSPRGSVSRTPSSNLADDEDEDRHRPHLRPSPAVKKRALLVSSGRWRIPTGSGRSSRQASEHPPFQAQGTMMPPPDPAKPEMARACRVVSSDAIINVARRGSQCSTHNEIAVSSARGRLGTAKDSLISQIRARKSSGSHDSPEQEDSLEIDEPESTPLGKVAFQDEVIFEPSTSTKANIKSAQPQLKDKSSFAFMSHRAMSAVEHQVARELRFEADQEDTIVIEDDQDDADIEDEDRLSEDEDSPGLLPRAARRDEGTSHHVPASRHKSHPKTPKRPLTRQRSEYMPARQRPKRQKICEDSDMASFALRTPRARTKTWSKVLRSSKNAANRQPKRALQDGASPMDGHDSQDKCAVGVEENQALAKQHSDDIPNRPVRYQQRVRQSAQVYEVLRHVELPELLEEAPSCGQAPVKPDHMHENVLPERQTPDPCLSRPDLAQPADPCEVENEQDIDSMTPWLLFDADMVEAIEDVHQAKFAQQTARPGTNGRPCVAPLLQRTKVHQVKDKEDVVDNTSKTQGPVMGHSESMPPCDCNGTVQPSQHEFDHFSWSSDEYGGWDGDGGVHGQWSRPTTLS